MTDEEQRGQEPEELDATEPTDEAAGFSRFYVRDPTRIAWGGIRAREFERALKAACEHCEEWRGRPAHASALKPAVPDKPWASASEVDNDYYNCMDSWEGGRPAHASALDRDELRDVVIPELADDRETQAMAVAFMDTYECDTRQPIDMDELAQPLEIAFYVVNDWEPREVPNLDALTDAGLAIYTATVQLGESDPWSYLLELANAATERAPGVPLDRALYEMCNMIARYCKPKRDGHGRLTLLDKSEVNDVLGELIDLVARICDPRSYYHSRSFGRLVCASKDEAQAVELLGRIEAENGPDGFLKTFDTVKSLVDAGFGWRSTGERPAVKTMFPTLDALLGGGLRAGLIGVAAAPGTGKTLLAAMWAELAARGRSTRDGEPMRVVYVLDEVTPEQIRARVASAVSMGGGMEPVTWSRIGGVLADPIAFDPDELAAVMDAVQAAPDRSMLDLCEIGAGEIDTPDEIGCKLRDSGARLAIIDPANSLKALDEDGAEVADRRSRVDEVAKALDRIARAQGIPIVSTWHVGQANTGRRINPPSMADFKESSDISHMLTVALELVRARDMGWTGAPKPPAVPDGCEPVALYVLKNRTGEAPTEPIWLAADYAHSVMFEVDA